MKDFFKIALESKDSKGFQKEFKENILKDQKAKTLLSAFKKDDEKIVDYIDYIMGKFDKEMNAMMKKYNVNYDESIDLITKGI